MGNLACKRLTHWGRVMHICVCKLTIIGSDYGLSPGRRQAIIWTNVAIWLIRTLGTNFSEILNKIHTSIFKKMHLKMSSAKWRPFCLSLNVLVDIEMPPSIQVPPHGLTSSVQRCASSGPTCSIWTSTRAPQQISSLGTIWTNLPSSMGQRSPCIKMPVTSATGNIAMYIISTDCMW